MNLASRIETYDVIHETRRVIDISLSSSSFDEISCIVVAFILFLIYLRILEYVLRSSSILKFLFQSDWCEKFYSNCFILMFRLDNKRRAKVSCKSLIDCILTLSIFYNYFFILFFFLDYNNKQICFVN